MDIRLKWQQVYCVLYCMETSCRGHRQHASSDLISDGSATTMPEKRPASAKFAQKLPHRVGMKDSRVDSSATWGPHIKRYSIPSGSALFAQRSGHNAKGMENDYSPGVGDEQIGPLKVSVYYLLTVHVGHLENKISTTYQLEKKKAL